MSVVVRTDLNGTNFRPVLAVMLSEQQVHPSSAQRIIIEFLVHLSVKPVELL